MYIDELARTLKRYWMADVQSGATQAASASASGWQSWTIDHMAAVDPHPVYLTQPEGDALYVPLSRLLTSGDGINAIGNLSANRTISVNYGAGLTIAAGALVLGTPSTLNTASVNSATGTTHSHAATTTTVGAVSTIVATNSSGDIQAGRHIIAAGGLVQSLGTAAGLLFQDQAPGNSWTLYSASAIARLNYNATDVLTIDANGNVNAIGYLRSTGATSEVGWQDRTQTGTAHRWSWQTSVAGTAALVAATGGTRVTVTETGGMTVTGNLTETGLASALGGAAGFYTEDRTTAGSGSAWTMYADVGALNWIRSATVKMSVDSNGYATATRFGAGFTVGTPPAYALDGRSGSNQLRLSVDNTGYALFSVSGAGVLDLVPSGSMVRTNNLAYVGTFLSGFAGAGWRLDTNISRAGATTLELDDLVVRGRMRVYELLVTQIRSVNGNLFISSNGKIKTATFVSGASYTLSTGSGTSNQDDPYHNFTVGDLIRAQRFTGLGVYQSNMQVTAVANLYNFTATLVSGDPPAAGMDFVRLGNVSDATRQGSIYLAADDSGSPFIDIIDGVSSFAEWGSATKNKGRIGKLSGISDSFFGTLQGYGIYTNNGYFRNVKINGSVVIGSSIGFSLAAALYLKFDTPPNSFVPNWNGHLGQRPTVYGGVAGFPIGPFAGAGAIAIGESSTNLIPNPRFANSSVWSTGFASGANSTASQTTDALFGISAMQLVSTGAAGNRFVRAPITRTSTANPVTVSAWVKSNTGNTLIKIAVYNTALNAASSSANFTIGADWTFISWTATAAALTGFGTSVEVLINNDTDTTTKTIIIGFVQAEEQTFATPPISGDMGTGFSWAGTAHNSNSTRTAAGLEFSNSGVLPSVSGSAGGWFWAGTNSAGANPGYRGIFNTTGSPYLAIRVTPSNALEGYWGASGISGGTVTPNVWNHALITSDGVTVRLYLNGVQVATGSYTAPLAPAPIEVGSYAGAQQWMNGFLADLFITDRIVIADEALVITYANAPLAITRSNFELVLAEPGLGKIVGNAGGIYATDPNSVSTFTLLNSTQTFNGESLPSGSMLLGNNHATTGAANLLYNPSTGGLFIRNKQVNVISLLATANAAGQIATFDGVIGITTAGGIWQGSSGTFAAPNTGFKLYASSSKSVWEAWSGAVKQVYLEPVDMSLRAGAGNVVLNSAGIALYNLANSSSYTALKFVANDNTDLGKWTAQGSASYGITRFYVSPATPVTPAIHELILSNSGTSESSIQLATVSTTSFDNVSVTLYSGTSTGGITIVAPDSVEFQTNLTQFSGTSSGIVIQGRLTQFTSANSAVVMGTTGWIPSSGLSLSIGNVANDYTPSAANWAAGNGFFANIVLNGLNYTAIAFHDSGLRVDAIRVGAGVIDMGYNAGWGFATTKIHYLNLDPLTPASGSAGNPGDFRVDANYVYVCTATNTWKRALLSTY